MLADKIFRNALIISILFHVFIFYHWPPIRNLPIFKTYNKIELTYYPKRYTLPVSGLIDNDIKKWRPAPPVATKSEMVKSKEKDLAKPAVDFKGELEKPKEGQMLIAHEKKDFSQKPTYLSYYNAVRSNIYKEANANKPYYFMEGDVQLIFTLLRDGTLLRTDIIEDVSTQNPILRRHALLSIKRASPFPPFLDSMQEDQLTLRLTISFEK